MEAIGKESAGGLLMVLANVAPEDEAEFNRWYDREHMRERVAIPGFLSAQRYCAVGPADWKYLALYHTEDLSTFTTPAYRKALANQSPWSKQILTRFRDPQRAVAERTCRAGYGVGGAVRLGRLRPNHSRAAALREVLASKGLPALVACEGVCEASLFESDPTLSKPVPEYPKSSIDKIKPDDWLLLVQTTGPAAVISSVVDVPGDLIEAFEWIGSFSLSWDLHRSDL
jgi:hypothetical protein